MRPFIFAGALLMAGATIYGFVDYNRTSKRQEFKSMYEVNHPSSRTEELKSGEELKGEEIESKKEEAKLVRNKEVRERVTREKDNTAKEERTAKKRKKLDYENFSRGPLREEVMPPATDTHMMEEIQPKQEKPKKGI